MQGRRGLAGLATLVAIACVVSMAGSATGVAPEQAEVTACPADARPGINRPGPRNVPMSQGSHFSYPNRSKAERMAIRNRVLNTINSTWGWWWTPVYKNDARCVGSGDDGRYVERYQRHRGTIRMTTWSFNDWGVRDALIRAANRGTRVQIIAAAGINRRENYRPWKSLKAGLNSPGKRRNGNFARECNGACRGSGGAPHSKYFVFEDVGRYHDVNRGPRLRNTVVQTSMNLTAFAYRGQWNQATVLHNRDDVFAAFRRIFVESAQKGRIGRGYKRYDHPNVVSYFFPKGGASDPVIAALNRVRCPTRVRAIQYAIHGTRGNAVAKKLRTLWNQGCDVRLIYSISSRPVLKILRARYGRGPMPVRQSVIKNKRGEIVKYNHSKWLGIAGSYNGRSGVWMVHAGSANWSNLAYTSDEQMQNVTGYGFTQPHFSAFNKTWRQKTSKIPPGGRLAAAESFTNVPEQPTWGRGIYRNLSPYGD